MNRYICIFSLLFLFSNFCISQILSIENGIGYSHLNKGFNEKQSSYQVNLSCRYFDSKFFFISSSFGYIQKGGKLNYIDVHDDGHSSYSKQNKYITLNTCVNFKIPLEDVDLYTGIGPRFDCRLRSGIPSYLDVSNKILWGLNWNVGFLYWMGRFGAGVNVSYLPTFSKYIKGDVYKDLTFKGGVVLCYRI